MQLDVLFLSHLLAIAIEQIQETVLAFAYLESKQIYNLFIIKTDSHKL